MVRRGVILNASRERTELASALGLRQSGSELYGVRMMLLVFPRTGGGDQGPLEFVDSRHDRSLGLGGGGVGHVIGAGLLGRGAGGEERGTAMGRLTFEVETHEVYGGVRVTQEFGRLIGGEGVQLGMSGKSFGGEQDLRWVICHRSESTPSASRRLRRSWRRRA